MNGLPAHMHLCEEFPLTSMKKAAPKRVQPSHRRIPAAVRTLSGPERSFVRHMQAGILTQADTAAPAFPDYVSSGLWGPLSQYSNGIVRDSHPLPFSVRVHAHLHTHVIYFFSVPP